MFLTGQAGAGKTYVLNQYIEYLRVRQIPVAVTASTGIASTHMNGMTVHAWSGIGIQNEFEKVNLQRLAARDEYLERIKTPRYSSSMKSQCFTVSKLIPSIKF